MPLGHTHPVFFLAFDHRGVFARSVLDVEGEPTPEQEAVIRDCKALIFEGVLRAMELGALPAGQLGVLVDELYGADVARGALDAGVIVTMPVEKPDQAIFDFAYGDAWRAHVEAFEPDFAKVLVRYNVDGDRDGNRVQAERLRELSQWLRRSGRRFLLELLVPPTDTQLSAAGGDVVRFELQQRPELIARAIAELQAADVEPDVWKLEGIDAASDAQAIAEQARTGAGREDVGLTILGAGAGQERVDHWLRVAAGLDGFVGFAIGRSIWRDALRGHLAGTVTREDAADHIARAYLRFVEVYRGAARVAPPA